MYTPEMLSTFNAQIRAAVPSLTVLETALSKAQAKFDEAENLRKQMRQADTKADDIRGDIHAMKMTIKRVNDFYVTRNATIEANESELNAAFAKDIEVARKNTKDGSAFVQVMAQIKAIARMDLEDLSNDEKHNAEVALTEIKLRSVDLKAQSAKVNKLAADAYKTHAEGLSILKEAGLPADACKRKPEADPEPEE